MELSETLKQLFIKHQDVVPCIATANLILENCDGNEFTFEQLEDSLTRLIARDAVQLKRVSQAELAAQEAAQSEADYARYVKELNKRKTGETHEQHLERIRKAARKERREGAKFLDQQRHIAHERSIDDLRQEVRRGAEAPSPALPWQIRDPRTGEFITLDSAGLKRLLASRRESDEKLVKKMIGLFGIEKINARLASGV